MIDCIPNETHGTLYTHGGVLLKKLNYFEVMLNIFEFPVFDEIVESWLGIWLGDSWKLICMNHMQINFHELSNHISRLRW